VSCVDAEKVEKWYSVSPTQKEESTSQNSNHRQYVHHKVDIDITRRILCIRDKHLSMMLRELPYPISVKAHKDDWHVLAEPAKEL
jgi:hypothetical protein